MRVHVKLSTTLRRIVPDYTPAAGLLVDVEEKSTAQDVALKLALPLSEITIIMVNGRHADFAHPLSEGDGLAFFPAVGGG